MLETDGTQKRIYSQRKDLFSRNSARSIAENDDALIAMDEEHHLPENNKVKLRNSRFEGDHCF